MNVNTLTRTQKLPVTPAAAWEFFSSPANLNTITPPDLGFRLIGDHAGPMYESRILRYQIKIAPAIWVPWVTEIKAVVEGRSFVDEQRAGPYAFWHHRHTFDPIEGGVLMTDLIHYAVPFGPIGSLVHPLFVRPKLERVFAFRHEELVRRFGVLR